VSGALSADLLARCRRIATATWSDALDAIGVAGVCDGLTMLSGGERIAGPAVTIEETVRADPTLAVSEFAIGDVIEAAGSGDVLVVSMKGPGTVSTAGGLAARSAALRGVAGFVIDGACRDLADIRATGLFVASRAVTPRSGKGRARLEQINGPVVCGGVPVRAGDLVVADETGVVVVPAERAEEALAIAERLARVDDDVTIGLDEGGGFGALLQRFGPA
jgi:3-hexulose-6-phosphate synthase / 6-phospho-3-hexuloisomerase